MLTVRPYDSNDRTLPESLKKAIYDNCIRWGLKDSSTPLNPHPHPTSNRPPPPNLGVITPNRNLSVVLVLSKGGQSENKFRKSQMRKVVKDGPSANVAICRLAIFGLLCAICDEKSEKGPQLRKGVFHYPYSMVKNVWTCDKRTVAPKKFADLQFSDKS